MTTLIEAQNWLRDRVYAGEHCPCCHQYAKVYKRSINAGMARALITMYLYDASETCGWLHKPTVLSGLGAAARDESLLRYWGLIEEDDFRRDDGGRSGWWRVTDMGRRFVLGGVLVAKYALVYDGRCLGFDGPDIEIQDALGSRFDYAELMAA